MTAAHTGTVDLVKRLLERGAKVNLKETSRGQTALMWAAAEGHHEAVDALIMHGADVHARSNGGYTPLLLSARTGRIEIAAALLHAGAEVNEAAPDGTTTLLVATIRGHSALVKFLLEHGADPNAGPGFTPLHWAAGVWNTELTGRTGLRDEGSEWGTLEGLQGQAKLDLVSLLLAHGANPNARAAVNPRYETGGRMAGGSNAPGGRAQPSMAGATPFWMASKASELDVMRLLLASGADPSLATNRKTTPLMAAAGVSGGTGNTPVPEDRALAAVTLCWELGNDVNTVNVDGLTALHGAAFRGPQGEDTIIQFLVDKGAKLNVKDRRGWTPLTIVEGLYFAATNTYSPSAAELLGKLGAEPTPSGIDRNVGTIFGSFTNQ
jgi:ankyrin repeat protein